MARQQSGESEAEPLIVALAFFVLTTLTLGVLTYLAYGDLAQAREAATKAKTDEETAKKQKVQSDEKLTLYRVAVGTASEEDRTTMGNLRNEAEVRTEYNALMKAVENQVAGAVTAESRAFVGKGAFRMPADAVLEWKWAEGQPGNKAPTKPLIDSAVTYFARQQLAQREVANERAQLDATKKSVEQLGQQYKDTSEKLNAALAALPGQIKAATDKYEKILADNSSRFKTTTDDYLKDKKAMEEAAQQSDLNIRKQGDKIKTEQELIRKYEEQQNRTEDPFNHDQVLGHVTALRRGSSLVEIDLGSADNVRPGLTFSVQPSDTPQRGFQSRMRQIRGPEGLPVMTVVPKALIEVVEVVGPHSATARITSRDNISALRDPVVVGDVLYNSAWRKGAADHVALFGIFDVNGDGSDDIKQLVKDLNKMGIVVDAYFDLEKKKWEGELTERTTYAVEGNTPFRSINPGEPVAILDAKSAVRAGIDKAREDAKSRGTKVVRMRDFFPRIGYRVNLDVSDQAIGAAASRYLSSQPAAKPPATEEGK